MYVYVCMYMLCIYIICTYAWASCSYSQLVCLWLCSWLDKITLIVLMQQAKIKKYLLIKHLNIE